VHGRLSSIFGPSRNDSGKQSESVTTADWIPVIDIAENDNGYLLKVEIPGVPEGDVSVKMENRSLTISGDRKPDLGDGVRYLLMEGAYVKFARVFELPENVKPESVEARYRNGLLEVHVGKSEVSKAREIPVKAG
jgi:HSP20 family protein